MCMIACGLKGKGLALIAAAGMVAAGLAGLSGMAAFADDAPKKEGVKQQAPASKEGKKDEKQKEDKQVSTTITAGSKAPDFTLKDTAGNEVKLSTLLDGNTIVVLEFFNPDCPFVKKHHKDRSTFKDMFAKYKDKNVKFVAINSGAKGEQGHGLERNQKAVTDYGIGYPVTLDESGEVGTAYGAKRTPEMFVIGKDGMIAYHGAIDNNPSVDTAGDVNYVSKALDEMLAGQSVTTTTTKAYGCSVKYKKG